MTQATIRITDTSTPSEIAEAIEARCRRLMAQRARTVLSWRTRAELRDLSVEIEETLDEWLAARV